MSCEDTSCVSVWSRSADDAHVSVHEVDCWWIEVSGGEEGEDGVVNEDEVGVEWSTYKPVGVRFRSMESFPAGYHHPAVDDCRIEDTIPLA